MFIADLPGMYSQQNQIDIGNSTLIPWYRSYVRAHVRKQISSQQVALTELPGVSVCTPSQDCNVHFACDQG